MIWSYTYPLWSISNILNAMEKLVSGMLSSVTKKIYLFRNQFLSFKTIGRRTIVHRNNVKETLKTHSLKEIRPSSFTSNNIKNSEGAQRNSPGALSPIKYPSRTKWDSDGGNTGTTARIRSAGLISNSPSGFSADAKYSNTCNIKMCLRITSGNWRWNFRERKGALLYVRPCTKTDMMVH